MSLYFEKQKWQQCALHTTNNFLQHAAYTRADFDALCKEELPIIRGRLFSPYKSAIPGIGNYDASVIIVALRLRGFDVQQHDNRKPLTESCCQWPVVGIVVNTIGKLQVVPERLTSKMVRWTRVGDGRHFYCYRRMSFEENGVTNWVLLDSMLAGPVAIGDVKTLVQELEHLRQNDACLYIVKPSASSEDRQDKEQDQNENNIADCNKS
eukprot:gene1284-4490_t